MTTFATMWTRSRYNPETSRWRRSSSQAEIFQLVGLRVAFVFAIGAGSVWLLDRVPALPTVPETGRSLFWSGSWRKCVGGGLDGRASKDLAQRDDAVYRTILGVQPVPDHLRHPGIGGVDRQANVRGHVTRGGG